MKREEMIFVFVLNFILVNLFSIQKYRQDAVNQSGTVNGYT